MTKPTTVSFAFLCGLSALALHCVGDDPSDGAPSDRDAGSSSGNGGSSGLPGPSSSSSGSSGTSSGGPLDPDASPGTLAGRVVDTVGLAAASAEVRVVQADGTEILLTTDTRGAFTGTAPSAPFDLKVRRSGSRYLHVFRGLTRFTPVLRLLGETSVVGKTIDVALTLPTDVPSPTARLALVGTDPLETAFRISESVVTAWSTQSSTSQANLAVVLLSGGVFAGTGVSMPRPVDFTVAPSIVAAPSFARSGIRAGLAGVTVGVPTGIKLAFAGSKVGLAPDLAPAYAFTESRVARPFQAGGVPNTDGIKVTLEAFGAEDLFEVSGRGTIATAPFSYRRRALVGPDDVVDLALPSPASVTSPVADATGVSRAPLVQITAAASSQENFVSILTIDPKDPSSTASRVVYHFQSPEVQLETDALSANTPYRIQVTALGPFASMDDYLESGRRIPPELTEGAPIRPGGPLDDNALRIRLEVSTSDDGNLALTRSRRFDFTTAP